jgi:hypothetical protein
MASVIWKSLYDTQAIALYRRGRGLTKVLTFLQRPLPVDPPAGLTLRSKLLGVHSKGKGALVETETVLEAGGQQFVRIISGAFLVGANGFKVRFESQCQSI